MQKEQAYTIALATRLRRRVFTARGVAEHFEILLAELAESQGWKNLTVRFYDSGVHITLTVSGDSTSASGTDIADAIRTYTSGAIRRAFKELWAMPSLWTKRCYVEEGVGSEETEVKIQRFFETIPTR